MCSGFLKNWEVNSQWVDLRVDQIWNYRLEQDPSLILGLILTFLLHAHEEIETKRGEMILVRALGQSWKLWTWASTQPCRPSGILPFWGLCSPRDRALALCLLCGLTFYFGSLFTLIYKCFCVCMSDVLVFLPYTQLSLVLVKLQLVEAYTASGPTSCPHMWGDGGKVLGQSTF